MKEESDLEKKVMHEGSRDGVILFEGGGRGLKTRVAGRHWTHKGKEMISSPEPLKRLSPADTVSLSQ
jgi:hypothetical protein